MLRKYQVNDSLHCNNLQVNFYSLTLDHHRAFTNKTDQNFDTVNTGMVNEFLLAHSHNLQKIWSFTFTDEK